jgi:hypothetical protein
MFRRNHHQRIHRILQKFDHQLLLDCRCYFGGGTAIVLALDEYRESVDIDFLCADRDGYRTLRTRVREQGFQSLFLAEPPTVLREARTDTYGIRTVLEEDGVTVKCEIVHEGRIELTGDPNRILGVPLLSQEDLFAEKLLANSDRFADTSTNYRDLIDLAMMLKYWGPIPEESWAKARSAYGETVAKDYATAISRVLPAGVLEKHLAVMKMDPALAADIREQLSE